MQYQLLSVRDHFWPSAWLQQLTIASNVRLPNLQFILEVCYAFMVDHVIHVNWSFFIFSNFTSIVAHFQLFIFMFKMRV